RPKSRRRPIARVLVDTGSPGYQCANRLEVVVPGGSDQGRVAGGLSADGRKQDDERQQQSRNPLGAHLGPHLSRVQRTATRNATDRDGGRAAAGRTSRHPETTLRPSKA